jgi:hypothetical protein
LQRFSNVDSLKDGGSCDLHQDVAIADAGIFSFAAGGHMQGDDGVSTNEIGAIHPDNAIVSQAVEALLAEVDGRTAHCGYCKDKQQRTDELRLEIPQVSLSARTLLGRVLSPASACGEHLNSHVGGMNFTMRIQHLRTENKRVCIGDFVFGR